ncbi:MAG: cytochrome c [Gammaproteobacteria bacterium]
MMKKWLVIIVPAVVAAWWLFAPPAVPDGRIPTSDAAIERGAYLVRAGGCISCHRAGEDDAALSGGRGLETPFGTIYASNITPDKETGIGDWNGRDFLRALRHGRRPGGGFYYPAFPYRAYAGLNDDEVLAIAAWLKAQPPVSAESPGHELPWWLMRWQMAVWNRLAQLRAPEQPQFDDPQIARGARLARYLGHCGECHTPRNSLGMLQHDWPYAGAELGDDRVPAIDTEALADWSEDDFDSFLFLGLKPDGEFVGGDMGEVIEHTTSRLNEADREAMAAYFIRGRTHQDR